MPNTRRAQSSHDQVTSARNSSRIHAKVFGSSIMIQCDTPPRCRRRSLGLLANFGVAALAVPRNLDGEKLYPQRCECRKEKEKYNAAKKCENNRCESHDIDFHERMKNEPNDELDSS